MAGKEREALKNPCWWKAAVEEAIPRVSRAVMTKDKGSIWCLAGASGDRGGSSYGIKWIMVAAIA